MVLTELVACGVLAMAVTAILTKVLLPLAPRLALVDRPGGRKDHARPTPVVGGIAMILGVVLPAVFLLEDNGRLLAFAAAAGVLLVVGVLDDLRDIRWYWRIGAQSAAALIMIYAGGVQIEQIGPLFGRAPMALGSLSVPFTVFATVGLINAINMADGIDGLAASLVLAAVLMLGAAAVYSGNHGMLPLIVLTASALVAFLYFNLRRPGQPHARTFMGNAGSAFLGFAIAWFSFRLTQNPGHPVSPVLAPFLILFPLLDCLVLIARRLWNRRSPFSADRGHLHHLMLDAGFSQGQVVATLTGLSLSVGFVAALIYRWDLPHPYFVVAFLVLFALHFWITARAKRSLSFFGGLHRRLFGGSGLTTTLASRRTGTISGEQESLP